MASPEISQIARAIAAGAAAANDPAIAAIHAELKQTLLAHFGPESDVAAALFRLERQPHSESRQSSLEEDLAAAYGTVDVSISALARRLLGLPGALAIQSGAGGIAQATGSGSATAAGANGVAVGNMVFRVENLTLISSAFPATQTEPRILLFTYLTGLLRDTSRLDLSLIDKRANADETDTGLELSAIYTALRIRRSNETGDTHEGNPDEAVDAADQSAAGFVSQWPAAALLGDPGSGKTTFARFLALSLAAELLGESRIGIANLGEDWRVGALLPVLVILREFAAQYDGLTCEPKNKLWTSIKGTFGANLEEFPPHLRTHLLEKGGLLILDGLDEVPEANKRRGCVRDAIVAFQVQFPLVRILLTSRTYAYQRQEWRIPAFTEAVLAPFSRGQIKDFSERWYRHWAATRRTLRRDAALGRATQLVAAIQRHPALSELAERPLLLTLMAALHASRGGSLPEGREELYDATVDLLLDFWERPKIVLGADGRPTLQTESAAEWFQAPREEIRAALEELAYDVHSGQTERVGPADIPQSRLVDALSKLLRVSPDLKQARVIEFISDRAGLFLHRAEGVYAFPHRTFQEYLAARHLTVADFPAKLVRLVKQDVERWREALLLAGAKVARGTPASAWWLVDNLLSTEGLDDASESTKRLLVLLAGQVLIEARRTLARNLSEIEMEKLNHIRDRLVEVMQSFALPPLDRASAGQTLARLGDPRRGVGVSQLSGLPDLAYCGIEPGSFLMGNSGDAARYADEKPQFECHLIRRPYMIGAYPVTVAQFAPFIAADGYNERSWWTAAGWKWRVECGIEGPQEYGSDYDAANQPQVGVSWYEASAYCRWITSTLGHHRKENFQFRLPTEAEWERAARHTDGRTFPWGEADETAMRCNMRETGIGFPSAVGMFPNGDAVCGASDLAGNVLEWFLTKWRNDYRDYESKVDNESEGTERRVLRGGAFHCGRHYVRCASRDCCHPSLRYQYVGFRLVATQFLSTVDG